MKRQDLTVQVMGGLGNQLHGLSAGFALAGVLNRNLTIDTSRVSFGSNRSRRPELCDISFYNRSVSIDFSDGGISKFKKNYEKIQRHSKGILPLIPLFKEPDYFDSKLPPNRQCKDIQREVSSIGGPFIDFEWAEIAAEFGFPKELYPRSKSRLYEEILRSIQNDHIALHIRLGDYAAHKDIFPEIPESYYLQALGLIDDSENRIKVVFTDSPNQLSKKFPSLLKMRNIKLMNSKLSVVETLSLMSKYQHLITANSTFSSWAGWFSQKKTVITPVPHLLGPWQDTLPKSWTRIRIETL